MRSKPRTVESVREEVFSAIAEVGTVARAAHDPSRIMAADRPEGLFVEVTDRSALREAAASALTVYGGAGSFSDVGTAESHHAVTNLAVTDGRVLGRRERRRAVQSEKRGE